mgnify:CR=1 FL=1
MQLANCTVIISTFGDTVPKEDVTPAEVQYLIHEHMKTVGRIPVRDLVITSDEAKVAIAYDEGGKPKAFRTRTAQDEKRRLKELYDSRPDKENKVEKMFPGVSPNLPQKFSEVVDTEGNHPFGEDGHLVAGTPTGKINIGGKEYSPEEAAQLIKAGEVALKVNQPQSGSKIDPDEEE